MLNNNRIRRRTEIEKRAFYGKLIDAFDKKTMDLVSKGLQSKNPMISKATGRALDTATEMHNPATKNIAARGMRSAMQTVDDINSSRGAAVITANPMAFIGDSLQGGMVRGAVQNAIDPKTGIIGKALSRVGDAYGYGVENLPSQIPFISGPAQAVGSFFGKSASHSTTKQRLYKIASSRVKSPDAYYAPTDMTNSVGLDLMNTGNSESINRNIQQAANANRERTLSNITLQAPLEASAPNIQPNMPMTRPPFSPRYTGM